MRTDKKNKEITNRSDFDEFLEVLEEMEGNADHVSIDPSVHQNNKNNVHTNSLDDSKFYFDFSGDLKHLYDIHYKRRCSQIYGSGASEKRKPYTQSQNNSLSEEYNSTDKNGYVDAKKKKKDKHIKYTYKYNSGCYFNSSKYKNETQSLYKSNFISFDNSLSPVLFEERPKQQKVEHKTLTVSNSEIPSKQPTSKNKLFKLVRENNASSSNEIDQDSLHKNYKKKQYKNNPSTQKFKVTDEIIEVPTLSFVDIRDSDCELSLYNKRKKRTKHKKKKHSKASNCISGRFEKSKQKLDGTHNENKTDKSRETLINFKRKKQMIGKNNKLEFGHENKEHNHNDEKFRQEFDRHNENESDKKSDFETFINCRNKKQKKGKNNKQELYHKNYNHNDEIKRLSCDLGNTSLYYEVSDNSRGFEKFRQELDGTYNENKSEEDSDITKVVEENILTGTSKHTQKFKVTDEIIEMPESTLSFVDIRDSDCELSLYNKRKKRTKHKTKKRSKASNCSSGRFEKSRQKLDATHNENKTDKSRETLINSKRKKQMIGKNNKLEFGHENKKHNHNDEIESLSCDLGNPSSYNDASNSTSKGFEKFRQEFDRHNENESDKESDFETLINCRRKTQKKGKNNKQEHNHKHYNHNDEIKHLSCDLENSSLYYEVSDDSIGGFEKYRQELDGAYNENKSEKDGDLESLINTRRKMQKNKHKLNQDAEKTVQASQSSASLEFPSSKRKQDQINNKSNNKGNDLLMLINTRSKKQMKEEEKHKLAQCAEKNTQVSCDHQESSAYSTRSSADFENLKSEIEKTHRTKKEIKNKCHKQLNFVDIRDSDCEMSLILEVKNKRKPKKKKEKSHSKIDLVNEISTTKVNNDFKFSNIDEINQDLDTSGVCFEEDLSLVQIPKVVSRKFKNKIGINEFQSKVANIEVETSYNCNIFNRDKTKRKFSYIKGNPKKNKITITESSLSPKWNYNIAGQKRRRTSECSERPAKVVHKMEVTLNPGKQDFLPDLDAKIKNVLRELNSREKKNSIVKSLQKKRPLSEGVENQVSINVNYSDSRRHRKHWNVRLKNVESLQNPPVKEELFKDAGLSCSQAGIEEVKNESIYSDNYENENDLRREIVPSVVFKDDIEAGINTENYKADEKNDESKVYLELSSTHQNSDEKICEIYSENSNVEHLKDETCDIFTDYHAPVDVTCQNPGQTQIIEALLPVETCPIMNMDGVNIVDLNVSQDSMIIRELNKMFFSNDIPSENKQTEISDTNQGVKIAAEQEFLNVADYQIKCDDEIIMNLDEFLDLQNVDELFDKLSEEEKLGINDSVLVDQTVEKCMTNEEVNDCGFTKEEYLNKADECDGFMESKQGKMESDDVFEDKINHPDLVNDSEVNIPSIKSNRSDVVMECRQEKLESDDVFEDKNDYPNRGNDSEDSNYSNDLNFSSRKTEESEKVMEYRQEKLEGDNIFEEINDYSDTGNDSEGSNYSDELDISSRKNVLSHSDDSSNEESIYEVGSDYESNEPHFEDLYESPSNRNMKDIRTKEINESIRDLRIKLSFTPPLLHEMIKRSSKPNEEVYAAVRQANIEVEKGPLTKEEDEIIKKNWKSFLEEYKLDIPPSAMFNFPKKMKLVQKLLFLKYLSHGLDKRWPHSVHARFKAIYRNKKWKTGRFTKEEDDIIFNYLAETESRWPYKELEKILNRPSNGIWQRFHYFLPNGKKPPKWDLKQMEKLIRKMMKVGKCEDLEDLRHKRFSYENWRKISKSMHGVTANQVKCRWQNSINPRLFSDDVPLHIIKAELLKRLEDAKITDWKRINWTEISKDFHGYNSTYVCLAFTQMIQFAFPKEKRKNFVECLSILRRKYPNSTPEGGRSAGRKLTYQNGHLKYRDEIDNATC